MTKLILALLALVILAKTVMFLDPDFGWHLRTGQLISESGISKTDPFSYTMSAFPYVDHSWLTDVGTYWGYKIFGFMPLGAVFAGVILATIYLALRGTAREQDEVIPALWLLAIGVFVTFAAVRPVVFSWLFFVIVLWARRRWLIPLVFLLWANVHGGFIAGLAILVFRKEFKLLVLSLLATLINPYGLGLWQEVLTTVSDSRLRWEINEWRPSPLFFSPAMIFLAVVTSAFVWRYRRKYPFFLTAGFVFFLLSTVSSIRNEPYLVILSLPIVSAGFRYFRGELRSKLSLARLQIVTKGFKLIAAFLLVAQTAFAFMSMVDLNESYPAGAVFYLKNHLPAGQVFAPYNWGGYLIWKLPEKKVFIDGRMAIWRQGNQDAFRDYIDLNSGKADHRKLFAQYGINTVLWPAEKKDKGLIDLSFLDRDKKKSLIERLVGDKWEKIYEDKTAVIYRKPADVLE